MPAPITFGTAITPVLPPQAVRDASGSSRTGTFREALASAVRTVEGAGSDAAASVSHFLTGDGGELHTAALATERAELAFDLFLQARNKVVSAYQEIMRMQL